MLHFLFWVKTKRRKRSGENTFSLVRSSITISCVLAIIIREWMMMSNYWILIFNSFVLIGRELSSRSVDCICLEITSEYIYIEIEKRERESRRQGYLFFDTKTNRKHFFHYREREREKRVFSFQERKGKHAKQRNEWARERENKLAKRLHRKNLSLFNIWSRTRRKRK